MSRRVLLNVEDDDAAFYILELTLQEAGADIDLRRAHDGDQALRYLRRSEGYEDAPRPDLILLDINLPKRGGMEVLAELKADRSLRPIPVIIFTSSSREIDRDASMDLGAKDYVVKPPSLDLFVEFVKKACSLA